MKAQKLLTIAVAVATTISTSISCIKLENPNVNPQPTPTPVPEEEAPAKYVPYETEYINVPAGTKSIISLGNIVVATCYKSGYIVLPKAGSTKAISDYEIVNVPSDAPAGIASENNLDMVVAFEDTKNGDHDYNDLVFQAHLNITNATSGESSVTLDINPIAMGASITLGLGIVFTDADGNVLADKTITTNCRTDLFGGDTGFINTNKEQSRKKYNAITLSSNISGDAAVAGISWYLISKGERLYASNYFQACLDDSAAPQGLVLMNLRQDKYYVMDGSTKVFCGNDFWQYPKEATAINVVYPGFDQAFLEGGNFSIFANPTGDKYFDAIAADENGLISANCLYNVYIDEEGGETPSEVYYDNTGKATSEPASFFAVYNTFNHDEDNFILEFSTANGNAIDFSRGDMIEGKVTTCVDHPFTIGYLDPDTTGKTIEAYANGACDWWRIQDNHQHETLSKGYSFSAPIIFRISQEGGIEFKINGEFETVYASSTSELQTILALGTDEPLFFGLFGHYCKKANYEYLLVTRNGGGVKPDPEIAVSSISVENKTILVGAKATLTATVLPANATNNSVTWSSSDASVATVNAATGEVEGKAEGTCTITATSVSTPGVSGSCTITVTASAPTEGLTIWENYTSSGSVLKTETFNIISSGVPADDEICFANGDYIEVKFHRLSIPHDDTDLLYLGNGSPYSVKPNICVIGHSIASSVEIYMIPSGWKSSGSQMGIDVNVTMYMRFGCKADGTKGFGAYSVDGVTWKTLVDNATHYDVDADWNTITGKDKFIIQTARDAGSLISTTYDYLKIVRGGAQ